MRILEVALLALLAGTAVAVAERIEDDADGDETVIVTHGTDLEALGLGRGGVRVREVLETLSDNHRVEVVIVTVPRVRTDGLDHDVRYASRITALDAQGRRDGPEIEYPNWHRPPWRRAQYKAGKPYGVEQHFSPDGRTPQVEIPWENGEIHGTRRTYHPDGSVQTETPYANGAIAGESRAYDNEGRVIQKVSFKDGRRHGESIDYWADNPEQVQRVIPYVAGQVHGVARAYYLDGGLHWERPFVENAFHGVERHFDAEGEPRRVLYWLNNERVSEAAWKAAGTP